MCNEPVFSSWPFRAKVWRGLKADVWNKTTSFFLASSSRLQSRCVKQGDFFLLDSIKMCVTRRFLARCVKQADFFLSFRFDSTQSETRRLLSFRLNPDVWNKTTSFFPIKSRCVKQNVFFLSDLTPPRSVKQDNFFLVNFKPKCEIGETRFFFLFFLPVYGFLWSSVFEAF